MELTHAPIEIGDNAWVYALAPIEIGSRCCVGEDVRLLTGSHDVQSPNFTLVTKPIVIKDNVWVATGATILPGVTIGEGGGRCRRRGHDQGRRALDCRGRQSGEVHQETRTEGRMIRSSLRPQPTSARQ